MEEICVTLPIAFVQIGVPVYRGPLEWVGLHLGDIFLLTGLWIVLAWGLVAVVVLRTSHRPHTNGGD